jgi:hypothetical protein
VSGSKKKTGSRRRRGSESTLEKGVRRVTEADAIREDSPAYRTAGSPSPLGAERRGEGDPLRFIDLFCGIGGFRFAFEGAGGRCVFSSDWDKYSRQTYAADFGEEPHGDIPRIIPTEEFQSLGDS